MAEEQDVLTISTERTKRSLKVDGVKYSMRAIDELSLLESNKVRALCDKLRNLEKFTDEEAATASRELRAAIPMLIVGMPEGVQDKLGDTQRMDVVLSFLMATPLRTAAITADQQSETSS